MATTSFDNLALYADLYLLTMAQGYLLAGKQEQRATFDYFFRTMPFDGAGYAVFAGLGDLLTALDQMRFDDEALDYLGGLGHFDERFIDYLRGFRFEAEITAAPEGEVVFALEPLIRVQGRIIEAQLIEAMLLNLVNFQTLVATKAARIVQAAQGRQVVEFGLRRAQGFGSLQATRAAAVGGIRATSNLFAASRLQLPVVGTQAHAWIQSFADEQQAFEKFAEIYPDNAILLVDTYNTLNSGVPNAIAVAKKMAERGHRLRAIRLDSGDLAYLSKKARAQLDEAGLHDVQIAVSNQLDEHLIKSLLDQDAPIDIFGVGTRLVTGHQTAALDGVYKLSALDGEPCLKISDNFTKVNLPGVKDIHRLHFDNGHFYGDAISLRSEGGVPDRIYHPFFPEQNSAIERYTARPLLQRVMDQGELTAEIPDVARAADYGRQRLAHLPPEHRRFNNPHVYKVGLSKELLDLRSDLYQSIKERWRD